MQESTLGEAISRAVAAQIKPEAIEAVINDRVSKLIQEAVEQSLRSYSDTGKLIREKVEESLRVDRLDLPSYGMTVAAILKTQIEAKVADLVAGQLSQDMDELLKLAPKEVKLSEIAFAMLEEHPDNDKDLITVIVEDSGYSSKWIYLDERRPISRKDKYQCRHQLGINEDGSIFSARIDGSDPKNGTLVGRAYGLTQMLRAYVACGTKIIIDTDDVRTSRDYD